MAELIAQGERPHERWRRTLPEGTVVVLGRHSGHWSVRWDRHISRRHLRLLWNAGLLHVEVLPEAQNPVFYRGKECRKFTVRPGERFVVGQTSFTLIEQPVTVAIDLPEPSLQQAFSHEQLSQVAYRNPDHRIEVLSRLPEAISRAADDTEMCVVLVNMLLAGIRRADVAAVVIASEGGPSNMLTGAEARPDSSEKPSGSASPGSDRTIDVLHWDQRTLLGVGFHPSRRLILDAVDRQQSILHVWGSRSEGSSQSYTLQSEVDWAFCTPVLGSACRGWAIYVAGRFHGDTPGSETGFSPEALRDEVKFTEVVAAAIASLRHMRLLERRQASLSQFFSPVILQSLTEEDPEEALAPRETDVSVLFCDLRGFSRQAEQHADDLLGMLQRVSDALGVMTRQILDHGGVIGDFQGDAAMGFWGWPVRRPDAIANVCKAALAIRSRFEAAAKLPDSPLAQFRVGIGVATGRAVAGKIGTADQVKVTVFGPVVNLASRLEGMTKILRAPILLDRATADAVRKSVPWHVARIRRLAVVRPYGMDYPIEVSELLPPAEQYPLLTDQHLQYYEQALDAFLAGQWTEALEWLHQLPAADAVTDFLTVFIGQHNRTPPPGWDGVIPLASK